MGIRLQQHIRFGLDFITWTRQLDNPVRYRVDKLVKALEVGLSKICANRLARTSFALRIANLSLLSGGLWQPAI